MKFDCYHLNMELSISKEICHAVKLPLTNSYTLLD